MKRIFVGGYGRSGTTICLHALYNHPQIRAIPIETKFLVEEDGFYDLIQALTTDFSYPSAMRAIKRFTHLMRKLVTGVEPSKFMELETLSSNIFADYSAAVDQFLELVSHRPFFRDREPLLQATRAFIAKTFDKLTDASGKTAWAEKTPANFWRADFLRELWPDCYFIHMIRDPRAIMFSLMEKNWLERTIPDAIIYFQCTLEAFVMQRRKLLRTNRYLEVKLEELVASAQECLEQIRCFLEIEPFLSEGENAVTQSMTSYYSNKTTAIANTFSVDDLHLINQLLRPWVVELGYPLHRIGNTYRVTSRAA